MAVAALVLCLPLLVIMPGRVSPRGVLGAIMVGGAVMLYTVAVSYTDFIRAVLIFYIAPAWSLMIECTFLGRRWSLRALASIAGSFIGLLLISRGEISVSGVGALGDWMALVAGVCWSAGAALLFTAKRADFSWTVVLTLVGAVAIGQGVIAIWGSPMGTLPSGAIWTSDALFAFGVSGLYLAFILGCTMWGATRLSPTLMSFLLSAEILSGVVVSAVFLGEPFGLIEVFGAAFIIGAVLMELTRKPEGAATQTVSSHAVR
jgi:drug/metabolite transporter (DMT)-like permease